MRRHLIGSTALLLVTTAPSFAQDDNVTGSGDEIVVTATGLSQAGSTTKTGTPIIESPQSISIISTEEIELRATPTIADALSYTAGVQPETQGIDNRVDEVSVRGFGAGGFSSNNNFVDGLRMPSGGMWTRPGFDPWALRQIDVLKGPSGALYGQSAPGGVVNLVTKLPTDNFQAGFMLQGAGVTDLNRWNWQAGADVGGPLADGLSVRFVALARHGDTQVEGVRNSRQYLSPSVRWDIGPSTRLTVLGQYQRDEGGATFQFLPRLGTLVPTGNRTIAHGDNIGEPDWNRFDRNQYLVATFFSHEFSDAVTLRNNTRYTRLETLYRAVVLAGDTLATCPANIPGCIAGRTVARRAVQGAGTSDGWATDTQVEMRFDTGAIRHTLLAGADYFHTDWSHDRDGVAPALVLPVLDILNPVSRGAAGYAGALTPQIYAETVSDQTGIYLQDQISIGKLRVTVGGRYDWARDDIYNPLNTRRFIVESDRFSWRAGAVYLFDNGLAPYFSYSESFLPLQNDPTSNLNQTAFLPTSGQQYEAGLRYQGGRNIYFTAGVYQITQQNMLTPDSGGTLCGTIVCQVQTGEGRVRGAEVEARASLPWGSTIILTATRSDGEITRSATPGQRGKKLSQLPDWMASAFVSQQFRAGPLAGFGFGGGVRHIGASWGETNNVLAIPDYTLFDLFVRYEVGGDGGVFDGASFSINARNLADTRYVATCTAISACYYGQGRSITARLGFKW